MISSRCSSACGRSSLAISGTPPPPFSASSCRACRTSAALWTKLSATIVHARATGRTSDRRCPSAVIDGRRQRHARRIDALVLAELAAFEDGGLELAAVGRFDAQLESRRRPAAADRRARRCGPARRRSSRCVRVRRRNRRWRSSACRRRAAAAAGRPSSRPVRIFGPPRSCRIATSCAGRASRRCARARRWRPASSCVPCEKFKPDDVGAGRDHRIEHIVGIGRRTDGRDDLRVPHVEFFSLWARSFRTLVERYLSGLNRCSDPVLDRHCTDGRGAGSAAGRCRSRRAAARARRVDRRQADPRDRHRHRIFGDLAGRRAAGRTACC